MSTNTPTDRLERIGDAAGRTIYYDGCRGTYHTWYDTGDVGDGEPVSSALLAMVSSVLEVEPTDLEVLYECVDPDALDALVVHWLKNESRARSGSISFLFARCGVTLCADGEIVVDPVSQPGVPS